MKKITLLIFLLLTFSYPALAQNADDVRGGWIADVNGVRHVFVLVINDTKVTGTYCTNCDNPANLAFIDDGVFTDAEFTFKLYHDSGDASVSISSVEAELVGEVLHLDIQDGSSSYSIPLVRSPIDDMRSAPSGGFGPPPPAYIAPGPLETITPDKVVGLWLFGSGPNKQHFIFKRHKDGVRGMVCGPCGDAKNMSPLENIVMDGTNLHFDIVHENSGPGIKEYGRHRNITIATISENELHFATKPSFSDEDYAPIHMTLLGPVIYQP